MRRCLGDMDYRHFRALDEKHILFEGRRDRLWVNTLRTRCSDLRFGDVLVVCYQHNCFALLNQILKYVYNCV